jgi:hypothetical protein
LLIEPTRHNAEPGLGLGDLRTMRRGARHLEMTNDECRTAKE